MREASSMNIETKPERSKRRWRRWHNGQPVQHDARVSMAHGAVAQQVAQQAAIARGKLPQEEKKQGRFFRRGQWRVCWTCRQDYFAGCQDGIKDAVHEGPSCSCRLHECDECVGTRMELRKSARVIIRRRKSEDGGTNIARVFGSNSDSASNSGSTGPSALTGAERELLALFSLR